MLDACDNIPEGEARSMVVGRTLFHVEKHQNGAGHSITVEKGTQEEQTPHERLLEIVGEVDGAMGELVCHIDDNFQHFNEHEQGCLNDMKSADETYAAARTYLLSESDRADFQAAA